MRPVDKLRFCPSLLELALGATIVVSLPGCGSGGGGSGGTGNPTTPTPTNHSPQITAISASPAFGIAGLTVFTINATATDPDGDPVTYSWTFGGRTFSGASASTTLSGEGTQTAALTVSDSKGATASDQRSVTVGNMTGTWVGTVADCGSFNLTLIQTGGTVTGTFVMPNKWCNVPAGSTGKTDPAEPGTIDANGNMQIRLKIGVFLDSYFRGVMDSTGRRVAGGMFNSGFTGQTTTLVKQ
ncbi:MAG: hypothetical protein DMF86_10570 [Acidobacteria bacterium]|nr:MAG: hypothetical protein DMF86_10570 [Acidobacteriota bacterium]